MIDFLKTLWNHRAIIKELEAKIEYTEENARAIINLMWKEKVRVVINTMQKAFGYVVMVTDGKRHGYIKSDTKIPELWYIKNTIAMIRDSEAKAKKK